MKFGRHVHCRTNTHWSYLVLMLLEVQHSWYVKIELNYVITMH